MNWPLKFRKLYWFKQWPQQHQSQKTFTYDFEIRQTKNSGENRLKRPRQCLFYQNKHSFTASDLLMKEHCFRNNSRKPYEHRLTTGKLNPRFRRPNPPKTLSAVQPWLLKRLFSWQALLEECFGEYKWRQPKIHKSFLSEQLLKEELLILLSNKHRNARARWVSQVQNSWSKRAIIWKMPFTWT